MDRGGTSAEVSARSAKSRGRREVPRARRAKNTRVSASQSPAAAPASQNWPASAAPRAARAASVTER